MNDIVKTWLLELILKEIKKTDNNISKYKLWSEDCTNNEILSCYEHFLTNHEEYKKVLDTLKVLVMEDKLHV